MFSLNKARITRHVEPAQTPSFFYFLCSHSNPLSPLTIPSKLGHVDFFASHSWTDGGDRKLEQMHEWARTLVEEKRASKALGGGGKDEAVGRVAIEGGWQRQWVGSALKKLGEHAWVRGRGVATLYVALDAVAIASGHGVGAHTPAATQGAA